MTPLSVFLIVESWLMETGELPVQCGKCCGHVNKPEGRLSTGLHDSQLLWALRNWFAWLRWRSIKRRRRSKSTAHFVSAAGAPLVSYKYAVVLIACTDSELSALLAKMVTRRLWIRWSKLALRWPLKSTVLYLGTVVFSGFYLPWNLTQS